MNKVTKRLDDTIFALPIDNDYFLSYIFPSEDIIKRVPIQEYDVNAIIHKKVVVFCDQGEGKTSLVRAIVEKGVEQYGEANVNAVSSKGGLGELMSYGFDDKLVQIHFTDDFTLKKQDTTTIIDYFNLRHRWKEKIQRSCGLIVSIFGLHRFHSSQMEVRSTANVVVVRNDSINPYDHNVIKRFIGEKGVKDLNEMEKWRERFDELKSYSVYRTRTGRSGLLYFPLAEHDYLRDVGELRRGELLPIGERIELLAAWNTKQWRN